MPSPSEDTTGYCGDMPGTQQQDRSDRMMNKEAVERVQNLKPHLYVFCDIFDCRPDLGLRSLCPLLGLLVFLTQVKRRVPCKDEMKY